MTERPLRALPSSKPDLATRLASYVRHKVHCRFGINSPCTCGLDELLAELSPPK